MTVHNSWTFVTSMTLKKLKIYHLNINFKILITFCSSSIESQSKFEMFWSISRPKLVCYSIWHFHTARNIFTVFHSLFFSPWFILGVVRREGGLYSLASHVFYSNLTFPCFMFKSAKLIKNIIRKHFKEMKLGAKLVAKVNWNFVIYSWNDNYTFI